MGLSAMSQRVKFFWWRAIFRLKHTSPLTAAILRLYTASSSMGTLVCSRCRVNFSVERRNKVSGPGRLLVPSASHERACGLRPCVVNYLDLFALCRVTLARVCAVFQFLLAPLQKRGSHFAVVNGPPIVTTFVRRLWYSLFRKNSINAAQVVTATGHRDHAEV